MEKKKRRNKSDLGENFIAPDGGWGWIVCIAGGFSNFCILPPLQLFGLIFRDRLIQLGLTSSQITTIINVQPAVSSCTGLLNGPMFRRFSYRQIALTGAALISSGIFFSSMADSFATYIISFSILYGCGMGICFSSTSLAVNTYFKEKRRRANSTVWTIAGLGAIFLPYLSTVMLNFYGVQGTVMLFSGLALNIFACALVYQPVRWHIKKLDTIPDSLTEIENELCEYCQFNNASKSFQELSLTDDTDQRNCEILEAGAPMLSHANDGWYGSKMSLYSRRKSSVSFRRLNSNDIEIGHKKISLSDKDDIKISDLKNRNITSNQCTCTDIQKLLPNKLSSEVEQSSKQEENEESAVKYKWYQKIAIFFDLDLLNDFTYVTLMLGSTFAIFADLNFSILTPFILFDFGFTKSQIAFAMSLLGFSDVIVRFVIPFVTERIKWKNITFFLIGIFGMVIGRVIVSLQPSYEILLVVFVFLGCCKGIRTIFMGLIMPSYVPLKRLPAASGLALLCSGMFTLSCGPLVGIIKDATNFSITINILNVITMITVISWTIMILKRKRKMRMIKNTIENKN